MDFVESVQTVLRRVVANVYQPVVQGVLRRRHRSEPMWR